MAVVKPLSFETLEDDEGRVTVGWVGDSVLHARIDGGLSGELGARYATHVAGLVRTLTNVNYFGDVSGMTRYDLLARSAFVRMIAANRRRFASFTFRLWEAGSSQITQAFAAAMGDNVHYCVDGEAFELLLLRVAPLARQRLDPAVWKHFESSQRSPR